MKGHRSCWDTLCDIDMLLGDRLLCTGGRECVAPHASKRDTCLTGHHYQ